MGTSEAAGDLGTDDGAWCEILAAHRDRLRRMVSFRLDQRLKGRVDPSDVIQEALLEATERRSEHAGQPDPMPAFLWLRFLTLQRLQLVHRKHLGTKARDAGREVSIDRGGYPAASSAAIAARLLGRETRASEVAMRGERQRRLQELLDEMDGNDREVLVLRHFEQLSNRETANVLRLTESAATKRYIRALKRLKEMLAALPGGENGVWP